MKHVFLAVAAASLIALGGLAAAGMAGNGKPSDPPGQGDCNHGNSNKPCKDDPQPNHGGDCDEHGPKEGGVNEDHCKGETTPTTPTETTPTETTPTETTPTTPQETTPSTPPDKPKPPVTPPNPKPPVAPPVVTPVPSAPSTPSTSKPKPSSSTPKPDKPTGVEQPSAPVETTATASEALPNTGFPLWLVAILGGIVAGTGVWLRKRA